MSQKVQSKFDEHLSYLIYDGEEDVEIIGAVEECSMNCKFCSSLNDCEWGMHSLSL